MQKDTETTHPAPVVPGPATDVEPTHLLELGLAFWGSKTLLTAVELGIPALLAGGSKCLDELTVAAGLHPRVARDFLDALVALGVLDRSGTDRYLNAPATDLFLDPAKPSYAGGLLEMANHRMYGFWGSLTEAVTTGLPQNESRQGIDTFEAIYSDPQALRVFLGGMTGASSGIAHVLAEALPWERYGSVADVGGAEGCVPVALAQRHPHLVATVFDLPQVGPIAEEFILRNEVADRVGFAGGDFFQDSLPTADVIVLGHILHDWDLATKQMLLAKAYAAVPVGGAVVVYDAIIDDDRRENSFGLLMSLNMVIETEGGFDYTGADCQGWMHDAGFTTTYVQHLTGPDSMVVAIK